MTAILICPEPIRPLQQGIGIRFLEMATTLHRVLPVVLWAPNHDLPDHHPFPVRPFPTDDFAAALSAASVVILHGHISERYFAALERHALDSPPLVVDLYDPFLIENLQYLHSLGETVYHRDRGVLIQQLAQGDYFLAASEAQRLFYIGLLIGMGRLQPDDFQRDSSLNDLIAIAPFGVRPQPDPGVGQLKGVVPGIHNEDTVLFFGGVYDWYDPDALLDSLVELIQAFPGLRCVFCRNPNPDTTPQTVLGRLQDRAAQEGWLNRHLFLIDWFPYAKRAAYFRDVDLAIALHHPSLETRLSLRTRILEFMGFGIPVVATEGGGAAELLAMAGAGRLIPPGDRQTLTAALSQLLADPEERRLLGQRGREFATTHLAWEQTLSPLMDFCRKPVKRAPRPLSSPPPPRRWQRILAFWRTQGSRAVLGLVWRRLRGLG